VKALQTHLLTLALALGSTTVGVMQAAAQDRGDDQEQSQHQKQG